METEKEFIIGKYYESTSDGFVRYEGLDENGEIIFIGEDEFEVDLTNLEWYEK